MDLVIYICLIVVALLLLALWYAYASGLFFRIQVETTVSPYPNFHVAYKFLKGPYKNVGNAFEEIYRLAPEYQSFAIYYDDPNQVPASDLRAIVGSILAEEDSKPDETKTTLMAGNGYAMFSFPKVDNVVRTWFPLSTRMSVLMAVFRVWPKLAAYVKLHSLKAFPWMEICTDRELHYVGILDHHEGFIVPQVKLGESTDH